MKTRVSKTVQPIRLQSERDAIDSYLMHKNPRDRVMFALGIYMGRRISDLVSLNVRDVAYIDRKGRLCICERLVIQERKTGKFADLVIHPKVRRILSKYLRQRRKHCETLGALLNEPLLKSKKSRRNGQYRITRRHALRVLTNAAHDCGLNYKIGTHSLRKTFGYIQHQNGTSIELIQKMLNHSSPEVTLSYIGITRDDMDEAMLSMD
ncbi:MAG: tyrosine-type recombinase/integrase [Synergistaceae bacterium]|nr:tyrosine-type recombinase/integrase [Synergistaceae bacterium]